MEMPQKEPLAEKVQAVANKGDEEAAFPCGECQSSENSVASGVHPSKVEACSWGGKVSVG